LFDFFSKKRQEKALREEDDKAVFINRYKAFQEILKNNNEVLITMADMQEKATGEFVFDRAYVLSSYETVANGVKKIIENLNVLADNKYADLTDAYQKANEAIQSQLKGRISIPKTDYVLPIHSFGKEALLSAGGKIANLAELRNVLDLPVPSGFVITTFAYQTFVQHNQIQGIIDEKTANVSIRDYDKLAAASRDIIGLVRNGRIPPDLEEAILKGYQDLCEQVGNDNIKVSVRSSAIQEDVMASFAGQYSTALSVSSETLLTEYKNIMSSLFTPRALFYYKDKGFHVEEMAMAVGFLAMIDAKTSGVIYSRDPGNPEDDSILVNAVWGLGAYAVGGTVPTDNYRISGNGETQINRQETEPQEVMLIGQAEGGTRDVPVPEELLGKPCLNDEAISQLASWARQMEGHFGRPQDIEWAMDPDGKLYLLQSRPLRIGLARRSSDQKSSSTSVQGHKRLLDKGVIACRGTGAGPVRVVKSEKELTDFPEGAVLVTRHTPPEFAVVIPKAAAIVSDIGTVLGHLATVAREYNIPAVFNTHDATRILSDGMEVTVDAVRANVYEGTVKELLKEKQENAFESSPALAQLREVLQLTTPLNLTDPNDPGFRPTGCKTLHDITRFAHEVSMHAMFNLSKESHFAEQSTKQLVCEVPMQWWIIDLGDGIKEEARGGKRVKIEDIISVPMQAVWDGITALPWKGPPPVNTKGFLSVMFGATTDPSIDPSVGKRFADKNYIILSKYFCNLNSRLGFHFSTTEAYVGENPNENYVSFVFKGGAADLDRRVRRVQFVGKVLSDFDFRVEIKDDALFARLEGHESDYLRERLKVLGHVMTHTRQLDMVMYNDAMVNYYYEDMLKAIKSFVNVGTNH